MTALVAIVAVVLGVLAFRKAGRLERELAALAGRLERVERDGVRWMEQPVAATGPAAAPGRPALPAAPVRPAPVPPSPPVVVVPAPRPVPTAVQSSRPASPAPPPAVPPISSGRGWEQLLGGRVLVWLGALAMMLGVVFLVRQFAGELWLLPEFRLAAGTILGVGLLATGEWLRRRSTRVASGTSAAGIGALFSVAYAATSIYGYLSPVAGFAFLALVAFAAVLLSLRQGMLVAILGLVGGMATPALVSSGEPRPALLFGYLLLLQVAVFAVARRSAWWPLALLNLIGGVGWVVAWLAGPYLAGDSLWLGLFLLASAVSAVTAVRDRLATDASPRKVGVLDARDLLIGGGVVVSLLALAGVVVRAGFGALEWGFVFVLAAGSLALAALAPRFRQLGWLTAALVGALVAAWGARGVAEHLGLYFGVLAAALGLYALVPYVLHRRRAGDVGFVVLSALTLVVVPLLAHVATFEIDLPFSRGLAVLVLAGLAIGGAVPLARARAAGGSAAPLGAFAAAATSLVSLAIPLELEREWWSVGWALEVPALAWLATRLSLPLLGRLGVVVAAAVVARLTLNPFGWTYPIGDGALLNWLLYGYGVPVLALGGAVALVRARGSRRQGIALEAGATLVGFVWIVRAVHQFVHRGVNGRFHFVEWAWVAGLGALVALALVLRGRRKERIETEIVGLVTLGLALLTSLAAAANLFHDPVGELPILNGLLMAFAVPAVVSAWLAFAAARSGLGDRIRRTVLGVLSLGLTFVWLTLEVRHLFRGTELWAGAGSNAEGFAYSAAWVVLGTALLVFGLRRDQFALRLGGLVVVALAAAKVFLFDVAGLGDLYRVLSFLGLGASLLGLGYLYQRFVRSSS
jgi:uncharacterized membrane protein